MLYRENGQFKTSYVEDQQILPIVQDRWFMLRAAGGRVLRAAVRWRATTCTGR
jgi:hypothetical protein